MFRMSSPIRLARSWSRSTVARSRQVKRPANFDWFANCSVQTTGVRFTISQLVNGQYVPTLAGVTDVNGLVKFNESRAGHL